MERSKRRLSPRAFAVLVSLLATHAASWGQPAAREAPEQDFLLGSGIVVDADRAELFLMRPEGGIEAIDTELGRTLWTSTDAARPVALKDGLLLAQAESVGRAGEVGFVLLEADRGATVRTMRLELPVVAWTGVDDGLGATFDVQAWNQQKDLMISWTCRERVVGGANLDRPAPREELGLAQLEPARGRLRVLAPGEASPPPPPRFLLPATKQLTAVAGRQFLSIDRRHILASERVADDRVWEKYSWTVYDRASGEQLGQVRSRWSMTEFFVTGTNLIHRAPAYQRRLEDGAIEDSPLAVRAIDLASGTELWRRSVRDTKYRGPFPP